jgi:hypothetical protein
VRARWARPWVKNNFLWNILGYKRTVEEIQLELSNTLKNVSRSFANIRKDL